MPAELGHRVLLAAPDDGRADWRSLLPTAGLDIVEVASIEQAGFVHEAQPCDVVVLDGRLAGADWCEALDRLDKQGYTPILLLSDPAPAIVLEGFRREAAWLPTSIARQHPELLVGALEQAIRRSQERQRASQATDHLRTCHARVDRLLELLWETVPGEGPIRWLSQRHMLERLEEEVARTRRYGGPLSIVLGELEADSGERLDVDILKRLGTWMAQTVGSQKRRSDVAGQYGLAGFMLLLPRVAPEEAAHACQRLGSLLQHPAHDDIPAVHARFGVASVPTEQLSVQTLLRYAEERLEETRIEPQP
jgi:GGDEF domain-containing protein